MAFDEQDFEAFVDALGAHPEWQARLRRLLLDDEIARLREDLAAGFARVDAAFERIAAQLAEQGRHIERLAAAIEAIDRRLTRLEASDGSTRGVLLEVRFQTRANAIFGRWLRSIQVVAPGDIREVFAARREGRLAPDEWDDIARLDLLIRGRDDDDRERYIAVEIAWNVNRDDTSRAIRRCRLLSRSGLDCSPVIAGEVIPDDVAREAAAQGVGVLMDGRVLAWPGNWPGYTAPDPAQLA